MSNQSWLNSSPGGGVQSIPVASASSPIPELPKEDPKGALRESWGADIEEGAGWLLGEASERVRFPLAQ